MKKREQIYTFLIDFIKEKGYQPTVREIAHAVNLKSSSSVYRHLASSNITLKSFSLKIIFLTPYLPASSLVLKYISLFINS